MQNANKNPEYQENFEISGIQYLFRTVKSFKGIRLYQQSTKLA
jgi:hypothetical protein